jgi:hypothetical protein
MPASRSPTSACANPIRGVQRHRTLIAADVADLPDTTISVREKWRRSPACRNIDVIKRFDAATRATLSQDIAPLMQWRDIRGDAAAYQFDHLIALAQTDLLRREPGVSPTVAPRSRPGSPSFSTTSIPSANEKTTSRGQVAAFWDSFHARVARGCAIALRGIMKYRQPREPATASRPKIIDVAEDPAGSRAAITSPSSKGLEFVAYRQRVEGVLTELFAQNDTLQRIKAGQPVSDADLKALVSLVLTQHPDLNLTDLTEYYPETAGHLDLAIRSIIGLDAKAVHDRFTGVRPQAPTVNSMQMRFLDLLRTTSPSTARSRSAASTSSPSPPSAPRVSTASSRMKPRSTSSSASSSPSNQSPPAPDPGPTRPDNTTPGNESSSRMITGPLRSKIDKLWLEFWQGGITNPLTVIEQITFLMFIRLLDIAESRNEKKTAAHRQDLRPLFSPSSSTSAGTPQEPRCRSPASSHAR